MNARAAPFYEQMRALAAGFEAWGACERTVALVALLRRAPWPALRLVARACAHALDAHDERAAWLAREARANDAPYLRAVAAAAGGVADRLAVLVSHLPMLRPGNAPAKRVYLGAVPQAVQQCVATGERVDLCQELLSYLLIHPALDDEDRRSLKQWLTYLETYLLQPGAPPAAAADTTWPEDKEPASATPPTGVVPIEPSQGSQWPSNGNPTFRRTIGKNVEFKAALDEAVANGGDSSSTSTTSSSMISTNPHCPHESSFSKNGTEIPDDRTRPFDPAIVQPKARRSNSLTPPSTSSYATMSSSSENLNVERFLQKPRSFSLSSEHSLLSAQAAISSVSSSSGSETRLDDLRYANLGEHDGMSTVAHWLKTLRLHKYIWLFSNISYDRMMSIDEDYLQRLGVTKGARHKLLLSIKKLSERQSLLEEMERELSNGSFMSASSMTALLEQLRNIVLSPIKPESPLAASIVRVLDLASARILAGGSTLHDGGTTVSLHCWLVDRALAHDAFSRDATLATDLRSLKHRVPPRQFLAHLGDVSFQRRTKPRYRNCLPTNNWQPNDGGRKSSSYPSFPQTPPVQKRLPPAASMGDINSRLESLCLQMTEQAIN